MTNEATDFEITIYGFRDSDHMVDWLKDCRRAGEAFAKRHRQRKLASPETVTPTTPLRLDIAAQLAFPDGSIGVSGLRREIARGNLRAERIAGKIFVTLAAIEDMRTRCAIQRVPDSTCASRDDRAASGDGSSSIPVATEAASKSAQAHLQTIVEQLKKPSLTTSQKSTSQTSAKVVPIKS
jgi:hypothetical protein